ncbi:antitoxin Xre/MbcA/ParS toxin-binding domain-containing protein [Halomonas sp. HK25]|uniref:antitoxin Xre/MbcA/ParS toxin-binding domain-containing protein n=1 Tax=Halomonas sp. HK25 TaxID=3394321 RepID=UPI0039FDB375
MSFHDLTDESRSRMSAAVMRTYPNIVRDWQLHPVDAARLLGVSVETYRRWSELPEQALLDRHHLERMSLILGIYQALQVLLPSNDAADSWLHRPNNHPMFGGQPPWKRLKSGHIADLYDVRKFLEAKLQRW